MVEISVTTEGKLVMRHLNKNDKAEIYKLIPGGPPDGHDVAKKSRNSFWNVI